VKISAFWPLALFFAFSSLAFGCMEGWSIATCEVILFLGAAAVGWNDGTFWAVPKRLWLAALLGTVLIAVGLLQIVPLPAFCWKAAGAERYAQYEEGAKAEELIHTDAYRRDPFGPDSDKVLSPESWTPLTPKAPAWIPASFTPASTFRALLALAAALCLVLLLERLAEEGRDGLRRLAWVVGGLGLLVMLIALVQHPDKSRAAILWILPSQRAANAFGPFVNPNHGEAFVNLAVPFLYFLLWRRSLRMNKRAERWGIRAFVAGLLCLHIAVLAVSHSRGAFLAPALYPFFWLLSRVGRGRRWAGPAAAIYVLAGLLLLAVVWRAGLLSDNGRRQLNANVPFRHLVLGNGLNSFDARFPAVLTDFPTSSPVHNTHLENEYLQLFFEGGLAPAMIAVVAGLAALWLAWRSALVHPAAFWPASALAAETLRCSVDFTGHVFPVAGAFLLTYMMATLCTSERGDMPEVPSRTPHGDHKAPLLHGWLVRSA